MTRACDLDALFNYRLWKLHAQASAPVIRLCEGRFGITRREWRLLALLGRDGELSPSALAERGALDRARVSKALGTLLAKGLVERSALAGDRRQARVALSQRGRSIFDELFPLIAQINAEILSILDPPARASLEDALERLTGRAVEVNRAWALDVQANRRRGGSRHRWTGATDLFDED